MSQEQGFKVATGPHDWVMVQTAEDAVKLGKAFATLVADLGVYKAERDRLEAKVKQLEKAGDWMLKTAIEDSTGLWVFPAFTNWLKVREKTADEIGALASETLSNEGGRK